MWRLWLGHCAWVRQNGSHQRLSDRVGLWSSAYPLTPRRCFWHRSLFWWMTDLSEPCFYSTWRERMALAPGPQLQAVISERCGCQENQQASLAYTPIRKWPTSIFFLMQNFFPPIPNDLIFYWYGHVVVGQSLEVEISHNIHLRAVWVDFLPTTISVNSKPFFTDFRWTWLGRFANPT